MCPTPSLVFGEILWKYFLSIQAKYGGKERIIPLVQFISQGQLCQKYNLHCPASWQPQGSPSQQYLSCESLDSGRSPLGELGHSEPAHEHHSETQSSVLFPISTAARKPQNRSYHVNMRGWKQVECHDKLALPPRWPQNWKSMLPSLACKNTVVAGDSPRGPSVASSRKPHGVITNWVQ